MKNIALALGQIEEAMGALDDGLPDCRQRACEALVRARQYQIAAIEAEAARVPVAHYTPISAEEVAQSGETWPLRPVGWDKVQS